jgi:hypothetical protein
LITRRRLLLAGSASVVARPALAHLRGGMVPGAGGAAPPPSLKAVSSIGTASGRDFTGVTGGIDPINQWWAAVKALPIGPNGVPKISIGTYPNGVTGQCWNDSEFTPQEINFDLVDTSDFNGAPAGTFAITLTAAPGQSFADNPANALTYNQANGVGINCNQLNYTDGPILVAGSGSEFAPTKVTSLLISRLQIKGVEGNFIVYTDNGDPTGLIQLQQCIIDNVSAGWSLETGTATVVQNCLVILRDAQPNICPAGAVIDGPKGLGGKFYGCTIVAPNDNRGSQGGLPPHNAWASSYGDGGVFSGTTTWSNCAFFGFQQISNNSGGTGPNGGALYTSCATDSPANTVELVCTPHAITFTARIDNGTVGTAGLILTVAASPPPVGTLTTGLYVGGTYAGSINYPGTCVIASQTGGTTGGPGTYTLTSSTGPLNVASQAMTAFVAPTPNTGAGVTAALSYANSFVGVTTAAGNWRLKSGSPLIGAGTADSTNLPYDIFGQLRPTSGAIDIGCHEVTLPALTMTVNGSANPDGAGLAIIAGDNVHVQVTGIASGTNILVKLFDSSNTQYNLVPSGGYVAYAGSTVDIQMALSVRNANFGFSQPIGLNAYSFVGGTTPGIYHVNLYFDSAPTTVQATVSFTIHPWVPVPFPLNSPLLNNGNTGLFQPVIVAAAGGTILAGNNGQQQCIAVSGNISLSIYIHAPSGGFSPLPTNITFQFYAVDGSLAKHNIGSVYAGNTPSVASFDTHGLSDGSYVVTGQIIDIADTSGGNWTAANFVVTGALLIVQNGPTAMLPGNTYSIPCIYSPTNPRTGSQGITAIPYRGVPVAAANVPYPSDVAAGGNYLLPVYNSSSPFNSSPASARRPPNGFYWEGVDGIRTLEYKSPMGFYQTSAGGIFCGAFAGKTSGNGSIESSYPSVAAGSYSDGPRNSNQTTNFTTPGASPTTGPFAAGGPFSGYHWTFIQEDGRLGLMNLAGTKLTIAGYKRDPAQLATDWLNAGLPNTPEWPNTVMVGGIDPLPMYTFGDFGGGAADFCWDPRDPYICYVSQTVDHCIIKCNFHSQTYNGVTYGPTFPLCQRYAGYKGGVLGDGNGGYVNGGAGRALGSVTGGVQNADGAQFSGLYSICMMQRTDGAYPQGTMFVADNYNGLIRIISAETLDVNGNQATISTVSTLVGLAGGAMPPAGANNTNTTNNFYLNVLGLSTAPIAVTSIAWVGSPGTTAAIVLAAASPVTSNGWRITLYQNGALYNDGSSWPNTGRTYGIYTLSQFTDPQHFHIGIASLPTGTITVTVEAGDTYSAPLPISIAASNCYTAYPNTIRMTSKGHILLMETWMNGLVRLIALSSAGGETANTIRRVGCFGSNPTNAQSNTTFGWIDVDTGVTTTAGSFFDPSPGATVSSPGIGVTGPQDDIVVFKEDSNPGSAAWATRLSLAGVDVSGGAGSWFPEGGSDFPNEGSGGVGHYPWGFCFSRTVFRIFSFGLDPTGWYQWRCAVSSDPNPGSADAIGGVGTVPSQFYPFTWVDVGWVMWIQGTRAIFPCGFRPAIAAMMGADGLHYYGANTGPTVDDLGQSYPSFSNNAALASFIQNGFLGSVKYPEFSFDDDATTPGRPLAALMYFIRRQSLAGSWPTLTPALFGYQSADGSGVLEASGQWSLNFIRPTITITSPGAVPQRINPTSIRVQWHTDKYTLGIICAGTPNSNKGNSFGFGLPARYNLWTTLEMDNTALYGTTHDVTITGLPDSTLSPGGFPNGPTSVAVLVIDRAGNWNLSANYSIS